VRRSRGRREVEQCLGVCCAVGTAIKRLREKEGRYDEADEAGRRQRSYADGDRQTGKATSKGFRRRRYGFHLVG
jgi:hypothetical protein